MTAPLYTHDCDHCVYLGVDTPGKADLYACRGHGQTSIIARYSSDGPDYSSYGFFNHQIRPSDVFLYYLFAENPGGMAEAIRRAVDQKLLTLDEGVSL